jgi:hypothetical protein
MNILNCVRRSDLYATRKSVFPLRNITPKNRLQASNRCRGPTAAVRGLRTGRGVRQVRRLRPEMGEPAPRSGPYSRVTGLVAEQRTQSDVQHGALRTTVGGPA